MTAAYLVNRSPSTAIEFKTPEERRSGKPPDLSNLKPFGCSSYAHQSEDKLDPRSLKCVFLGYPVAGEDILSTDIAGIESKETQVSPAVVEQKPRKQVQVEPSESDQDLRDVAVKDQENSGQTMNADTHHSQDVQDVASNGEAVQEQTSKSPNEYQLARD